MSRDRLRIRLFQVREHPATLAEERESFRRRCGVRPDQIVSTNVLHDPLTPALLDDVDAALVGGAGAYSVTHMFPWTTPLAEVVQACVDRAVPLFGSCWGHQFIARALGGRVVHAPERSELGTFDVHLTEAGRADPLFGPLPPTFPTQMGHQDWVAELPPDAVHLATNDRAPHQAFRVAGLPIYGTQFHSELDVRAMRERLLTYRAYYDSLADDAPFNAVLESLRATPHADALLGTFLDLFAVPSQTS